MLISALSFDLVDEAYSRGGFDSTPAGFLGGAASYTGRRVVPGVSEPGTATLWWKQPSEAEHSGSGLAIAIGALLDGIPESIVIGVSMIGAEPRAPRR